MMDGMESRRDALVLREGKFGVLARALARLPAGIGVLAARRAMGRRLSLPGRYTSPRRLDRRKEKH